MNKTIITILVSTLIANSTLSANEELTQIKQEGIKYIKMLGGALKKEIKKNLKSDPSGALAMGACSSKAGEITENVNKNLPSYAKVRRSALKYRNEANKPDTLDKKVMREYEASIKADTFLPSDIKVVKKGDTYRVYKPLIVKRLCLKCHGEHISKDIRAVIKNVYPNDKATGFKEGDFRGVIVAEIKK